MHFSVESNMVRPEYVCWNAKCILLMSDAGYSNPSWLKTTPKHARTLAMKERLEAITWRKTLGLQYEH